MKSVSWNQITEDIRQMWIVYWSISDPDTRKKCESAIWTVTQTMMRMHGFIPEEITNKQ